jgi:hypothetical protein
VPDLTCSWSLIGRAVGGTISEYLITGNHVSVIAVF